MERQLNSYKARYRSGQRIEALTEEQTSALVALINKGIEAAPLGKEFDIYYYMKLIRSEYRATEALSCTNLGIGEIGHMLVADDRIKWINCQCGGVGKFRKGAE